MKSFLNSLLLVVALIIGSPLHAAVSKLPESVSQQLGSLTDQADYFLDQGRFLLAAKNYQKAMDLLPKPLKQWSACAWLTVSLGDSYYFAGDYQSAQQALLLAMDCPGAHGNPYAHMRMGQVQLELGNCEQAANELTFALANAGYEVFEGEPPKYLNFAVNLLRLQLENAGALLQC